MINTSPFGLAYEPYMDVPDDTPELPTCKWCGRVIQENEDCYWLEDDEVYCTADKCQDAAIQAVGERHISEYYANTVADIL